VERGARAISRVLPLLGWQGQGLRLSQQQCLGGEGRRDKGRCEG